MSDRTKSILYIEDSDEDFLSIKRAFRVLGFTDQLIRAESGNEAIKYLKSIKDDKNKPKLILLDLNMPGIDGKEVIKEIKQDKILRKIPVIVLTTSGYEKDIEDCYEGGANSYIVKPFEFENLVKAMSSLKSFWVETSKLPG